MQSKKIIMLAIFLVSLLAITAASATDVAGLDNTTNAIKTVSKWSNDKVTVIKMPYTGYYITYDGYHIVVLRICQDYTFKAVKLFQIDHRLKVTG